MSITYSQLKTQLNDRFSYQRPTVLFTIHQDERQFNVFSVHKSLVFLPLQPKDDETLDGLLETSMLRHLKLIADKFKNDLTSLRRIVGFFAGCLEEEEVEAAKAKVRYEAGFRSYSIYYEGGEGERRFSWREDEEEHIISTIESLLQELFGDDVEIGDWDMGKYNGSVLTASIRGFDKTKETAFEAKLNEATKGIPVSVWFEKEEEEEVSEAA